MATDILINDISVGSIEPSSKTHPTTQLEDNTLRAILTAFELYFTLPRAEKATDVTHLNTIVAAVLKALNDDRLQADVIAGRIRTVYGAWLKAKVVKETDEYEAGCTYGSLKTTTAGRVSYGTQPVGGAQFCYITPDAPLPEAPEARNRRGVAPIEARPFWRPAKPASV